MHKILLCCLLVTFYRTTQAQPENRWQQRVSYTINVNTDVATNRFTGHEHIIYNNNSDKQLDKIFIHLYWNAFQPNSMMDQRSRVLGQKLVNGRPDWDSRVRDRILHLTPEQIGYDSVTTIRINGVVQAVKYNETILEVDVAKPIAATGAAVIDLDFKAQVPLQVRRSGRDNPQTGVRYSMSQWYPKICEYDYEGWHPTPYVAREFYGVWGDYDVTINIDKSYKLGGTGVLQNAAAVGWGYDTPGSELKPIAGNMRSWHFVGKNIHDFVWAADPDFIHLVRKTSGPDIHVIYNNRPGDAANDTAWKAIADAAVTVLPFIEAHFGKYPYPQYSFIQGGDGGMEYPMATLLAGSGVGTAFHEWMHSWFQMMLGTNESLYPWMDEGFTEFSSQLVDAYYTEKVRRPQAIAAHNTAGLHYLDSVGAALPKYHAGSYDGYFALAESKYAEPLSTHSDHYESNFGYSLNAYSKGCVFMTQLGYIIGEEARDKVLLEYYRRWRFKHPNANDFIQVAQDVSGLQLDWYKEYWVNTIKTIDYGIDSVWEANGIAHVRLRRIGDMPMPIDVAVTGTDGSVATYNIPLGLMFGAKQKDGDLRLVPCTEWNWTAPTYELELRGGFAGVRSLEIDPSQRMADTDRSNNFVEIRGN